jgi:general secretion pathway protein A
MYYAYFGLKEAPFSIAPNPDYLFMTERHQEALAHLYHGISADAGFVLLTGDVGTGKTTVCRQFLGHLPERTQIAFILNPYWDSVELLQAICQELDIKDVPELGNLRQLTESIYQHLLHNHAKGINTVLLIDEAQQIHKTVLEQIRLLTNLETNTQKLLKIILVGQPELNESLSQPDLAQLSQRITARYHISPLTEKELSLYIDHRLRMAGYSASKPLFPPSIIKQLFAMTQGVPRLINVICDRALLGVYAQALCQVNSVILKKAFYEVKGNYSAKQPATLGAWWLGLILLLCALSLGTLWRTDTVLSAKVWLADLFSNLAFQPAVVNDVSPESAESLASSQSIERLDTISNPSPEPSTLTTPIIVPETTVPLIAPLSEAAEVTAPLLPEPKMALVNNVVPSLSVVNGDCAKMDPLGWRCDEGSALNWQEFKKNNRPAVMRLVEHQQDYYVVVTAMTQTHVLVLGDQGEMWVSLITLGEYWTGEFTYLWQPPLGFERMIYKNANGSLVDWLAKAFSVLDKQDVVLADKKYNDLLKKRIELFQYQHGLKKDGKAGVETLLRLNEALGIAITLEASKREIPLSPTVGE